MIYYKKNMSYRKMAALISSIVLMCTAVVPCAGVYAEESAVSESVESMQENVTVSGDYSYSLDTDGYAVIEGCTSQETELYVPEQIDGYEVLEIGKQAFYNVPAEKIVIPACVEYISADNPFVLCESLKEIEVSEESENYSSQDGVLYSKDKTEIVCYPRAKEGDSFEISEGVKKIFPACFNCTSLKSVKIPSALETLSRHAFAESALEEIDLSGTAVEEISMMAFASCTKLKSVVFPENLLSIGLAAFYGCSSLSEIELPETLTDIGQSAFMGTSMTEVKIPSSVTSIGYSAFGYDESENPIENFTIIGEYGSAAQTYSTDTDDEYDYHNSFTFISTSAYEEQKEYESLDTKTSGDYEYTVTEDGISIVFCTAIDEVLEVPGEIDGQTVTGVYKNAFQTCGASEIILPDTVKTIGEYVFPETLKKLTIPSGCTEIGGDEPFIFCTSLESVTVSGADGAGVVNSSGGEYSSQDGVLYNKDKTLLIVYPPAKTDTEFTMPTGVKEIASSGFISVQNLKTVDLSGVETINSFAFEGSTVLESVKLSKDLKLVGNDVFFNCTSLKSVRLYDKIETIGDYAFGYEYDYDAESEYLQNQESGLTEEDSGEQSFEKLTEGFKIYTDEGTMGYEYAKACGIEIVENTVEIGGKNVDKNFLYVTCGAVIAVIVGILGFFGVRHAIKSSKKKSKNKDKNKNKNEEA